MSVQPDTTLLGTPWSELAAEKRDAALAHARALGEQDARAYWGQPDAGRPRPLAGVDLIWYRNHLLRHAEGRALRTLWGLCSRRELARDPRVQEWARAAESVRRATLGLEPLPAGAADLLRLRQQSADDWLLSLHVYHDLRLQTAQAKEAENDDPLVRDVHLRVLLGRAHLKREGAERAMLLYAALHERALVNEYVETAKHLRRSGGPDPAKIPEARVKPAPLPEAVTP